MGRRPRWALAKETAWNTRTPFTVLGYPLCSFLSFFFLPCPPQLTPESVPWQWMIIWVTSKLEHGRNTEKKDPEVTRGLHMEFAKALEVKLHRSRQRLGRERLRRALPPSLCLEVATWGWRFPPVTPPCLLKVPLNASSFMRKLTNILTFFSPKLQFNIFSHHIWNCRKRNLWLTLLQE